MTVEIELQEGGFAKVAVANYKNLPEMATEPLEIPDDNGRIIIVPPGTKIRLITGHGADLDGLWLSGNWYAYKQTQEAPEILDFDRHTVYAACLLAASRGVNCGAFGNACDRSNNGAYQSDFYQKIAAEYGQEADSLGESDCWQLYANSPHYPY